jgi:hypothetical protein
LHSVRSIEDRPLQIETNSRSLFEDDESDGDFRSRQQRQHRLYDELEEALGDKDILIIAQEIDFDAFEGLCCTNWLRDSLFESSVIAGCHEQLVTYEVQDQELAFVQHGAEAARFAIDLV